MAASHSPKHGPCLSGATLDVVRAALDRRASDQRSALTALCDIEDGIRALLPRDFYDIGSLPLLYRDFLACCDFEAQISNGGLHQAVFNSTGDWLPFLGDAYLRFDSNSLAYAAEQLRQLVPDEVVSCTERRRLWMDNLTDNDLLDFADAEIAFFYHGYDFSSFDRLRFAVDNPAHFFQIG